MTESGGGRSDESIHRSLGVPYSVVRTFSVMDLNVSKNLLRRNDRSRFSFMLGKTGTYLLLHPLPPGSLEVFHHARLGTLHPQSNTTLPQLPCFISAKPWAKSAAFMRWVMTFLTSSPDCSMAIILYQVSNISRP